jgi:sortase A
MRRSPASSPRNLTRGVLLVAALSWASAALLGGCSTGEVTVSSIDDDPVPSVPSTLVDGAGTSTVSPAPTSTSPTNTNTSTSAPSTSTSTPDTTVVAITPAPTVPRPTGTRPITTTGATTDPLPQPAPPPNPNNNEPYVELGHISIPRLGIELPLLEGIALSTLNRGPGHWPGTAMPGQPGNVVIAGHRVSHTKPFRHIDLLQPGDTVTLTTPDGSFVYVVTGSEVVSPTALSIVDQTATATATLFACHPPGSTKQRYVVHLVLQSNA